MKTLILDCSSTPCAAILIDGKEIVSKVSAVQSADTYLKVIDSALNDANIKIGDIDEICINIGPGSFTGLRVALSVGKGLGFGGGLKFGKYCSFDYIDADKEIKVLPGFSNFVYVMYANKKMGCVNICDLDKKQKYVTTDMKIFNRFLELGHLVRLADKMGFEKIYNVCESVSNVHNIEPLYLRASQAEIDLENKKRKNT